MSTESQLLAEMKPALRAALGESFSPEYVAGFVRRNRVRMESMLAPIVAACARSAVVEDVATTRRPTRSAKAPSFSELQAAALALTELRVKGAADSITKLRHQDVERVLRETPSDERRQVAYVLADQRPDLGSEIDEVMREVLHEPENWGEYGRQEIAKPGTRARREATAAEDAAERGRHREVFAEFEFDGTRCVIFLRSPGYRVRVTEGGLELDLDTVDGSDLSMKARESLSSMLGLPSSPGAIREGEALVSASLRDSIRQDNKWKAERVIYVFSLAARRIAAADVPVAPISTRAPTNAPSGRVNLSPAASRMLAKMTDGAWFLTFSRKATSSISAATELRDAGLAEITDHHNDEIRIALPMLTVENYERASTILNATHPEWGIKRFNRDPSDRGHHSYGTGSNSAVLFASDFAGWVVASWLPTVGEVAAEHVARGAYLDENRPGWRESKRAPPEVEWGGGLELAGTADSLTKTLDAMLPMIEEEERRDEGPKPVVMASLEAGGVVMLSPHGYLGTDLFRTYRDATARLQYVSFPRKGQRGTPSTVASAVLALERDGFEVRAATPDVVKSLIVTGGLDHALAVGPPPPVEAVARPSYRTSDPLLIARVQAMADDPPTSAIKYLLKTLGERGDLPLQVNDWKNGGKRSIDVAIEEGEQKVARKLARKPKAERLRADGGERPANGPNEEHAAQALIQLANMDPDKAREINDEGFSKSDVATGHALARRWEATGELTGDEWDWAVLVANKYRRQVGPLPEPTIATAPPVDNRSANVIAAWSAAKAAAYQLIAEQGAEPSAPAPVSHSEAALLRDAEQDVPHPQAAAEPYLLFRGPQGHEAHAVADLVPALEAEFGPDAMANATMPGSDPIADLGRWYASEHGLEYKGREQAGYRVQPWPSPETEMAHLERVAPEAAYAWETGNRAREATAHIVHSETAAEIEDRHRREQWAIDDERKRALDLANNRGRPQESYREQEDRQRRKRQAAKEREQARRWGVFPVGRYAAEDALKVYHHETTANAYVTNHPDDFLIVMEMSHAKR